MVIVMLLNTKVNLQDYAILTTCHLHNRVSSKKVSYFPRLNVEWYKIKLKLSQSLGMFNILQSHSSTQDKIKSENSKAYRFLDLDSNVIVESRDVEFMDDKFKNDYFASFTQFSSNVLNPQPKLKVEPSEEPRKSQRTR